MPKGRFPKLKGSISNIPIHANEITNILTHGGNSNSLAIFMNLLIWSKMLILNLTISVPHRRVFSSQILHESKK